MKSKVEIRELAANFRVLSDFGKEVRHAVGVLAPELSKAVILMDAQIAMLQWVLGESPEYDRKVPELREVVKELKGEQASNEPQQQE